MLRALLGSEFTIRAVTRNPDNAALRAAGVDIVRCNVDSIADVEEAVRGAYGVFAVTNFWDAGGELVRTGSDPVCHASLPSPTVCSFWRWKARGGGGTGTPHHRGRVARRSQARRVELAAQHGRSWL